MRVYIGKLSESQRWAGGMIVIAADTLKDAQTVARKSGWRGEIRYGGLKEYPALSATGKKARVIAEDHYIE